MNANEPLRAQFWSSSDQELQEILRKIIIPMLSKDDCNAHESFLSLQAPLADAPKVENIPSKISLLPPALIVVLEQLSKARQRKDLASFYKRKAEEFKRTGMYEPEAPTEKQAAIIAEWVGRYAAYAPSIGLESKEKIQITADFLRHLNKPEDAIAITSREDVIKSTIPALIVTRKIDPTKPEVAALISFISEHSGIEFAAAMADQNQAPILPLAADTTGPV